MSADARVSAPSLRSLRAALLRWYDEHGRDLPWRKHSNPYRIWVSEIMLQQTRVTAVLDHYRVFLERFPTVESLANAKLSAVLASWSGLGYYRRARAMHAAAKLIMDHHNGRLPSSVEELSSLPGIGRYTSSAIASIAFGVPVAVVDGNVERVLGRLVNHRLTGRSGAWEAAQALLDASRPGDWNQAMMELGALVCLPTSPKCEQCPVRGWCKAPGTSVSRVEPQRRKSKLTYGLASVKGSIYLVRRSAQESQMPCMWELPLLATPNGATVAKVKHSITTTDYAIEVVEYAPNGDRQGRWIKQSELASLPLTGLARKILRGQNLLPARVNQS